jgi:hypothetical protein
MNYEELMESKNWRKIKPNEIIIDCDDRDKGYEGSRMLIQVMVLKGYKIEVYDHGGKSYHGHIKDIEKIQDLNEEQRKLYKEKVLKKYIKKAKEIYGNLPCFDFIDFSVCGNHLIAEENKVHYRSKQIKRLIGILNENYSNLCEKDIFDEITTQTTGFSYIAKHLSYGITSQIRQVISINFIADSFGLRPFGKKLRVCPFHADSNPSLSLNEELGLFHCFGCNASGNIILFYALLKKLNPSFKIEVKQ